MTILDIYKKYKIMPQLAEHQLKVAAVAQIIVDGLHQTKQRTVSESVLENDAIITACLLHDMGNIIKFDLSITDKLLPGIFSKDDLEYWQKVKEQYILKYGADEHKASIKIVKELGLSNRILELVDCVGFDSGQANAKTKDYAKKICAYSDMRVGPKGVMSLEERLKDLRVRYESKFKQIGGSEQKRLEFENGLRQIEKQIFKFCTITPQQINFQTTTPLIESLKEFKI